MKLFHKIPVKVIVAVVMLLCILVPSGIAQAPTFPIPNIDINIDTANGPEEVSQAIQVLAFLTVITLVPSFLLMVTSFIRIAIVLSFIKRALSTMEMPPTQIIMGLALFLTVFVMAPTIMEANENAFQPFMQKEISIDTFYQEVQQPFREFMFSQTRENDIALFLNIAKVTPPNTRDDVPTYILIPAFMISELRTAFIIGVIIFIPFIVIDLIVASTLMSMGMIMLPPVMVSLPLKIILFIMVDGWSLIIGSVVQSFGISGPIG